MPTEGIEFEYTADISGITKGLDKIPGISKKNAKEMASNITKGLKDTEKSN